MDDIKRLCLDYYTTIEISWDVFCDKFAKFVSKDCLEINIPKTVPIRSLRTFASSTGWNEGIHSYALEMTPKHFVSIGIISSEDIQNIRLNEFGTELFVNTKTDSVVGYCLENLFLHWELRDGSCSIVPSIQLPIRVASEVVVVADCDNWKLKYYLDGELLFEPIDIIKHKTYHPVISTFSHKKRLFRYNLVETTIDIYKKMRESTQIIFIETEPHNLQ